LQSLRLCVSGSAALPPEVWNGLFQQAGQQVLERYGMTETVMLTSNPFIGVRKPGSVGLPLPGVEVSIHQPTADGVGELVVRGPNVFDGYLNRPEANAEAFLDNGWFRTGDLGRVDSDGYFSIVGRSKDLIISGGYNVYPSDVEAILRTHIGVSDVSVIGEPSELWGETVTACVVPAPSSAATEAELINFAAAHLATYQRPRRIVFCEAFPRNALGKVVKAELAQQIGHSPK
jgi:malonyl-CoA/methylmalonyl-CoA synthetase